MLARLRIGQSTYLGGIDDGVLEDDGGRGAGIHTVAILAELLD